jgi:hypothetical protein
MRGCKENPMRTSPLLTALLAAVVTASGCGPPASPAQTAIPSPLPANVSCSELSFFLDPALGRGFECEAVQESSSSDIPMDIFIYPAHTELTIQNYPLTHTQFPPQILIYPIGRFSELLPDSIPPRVAGLKRYISTGSWSGGVLPFLPPIPQMQTFTSHETPISFNGGKGVRFITEYSEGPLPISNRNIIYTFQGLTDDEMYWVAVTLPISSTVLAESYDTLPEGHTQESLIQNYNAYVRDVKDKLDAQATGAFSPAINSLDNLIMSISVR